MGINRLSAFSAPPRSLIQDAAVDARGRKDQS
jgi:hypothetical protein